jgi:GAF domain-containing protein
MRVDDRIIYPEATFKEGLISQLTVAMQFKDTPIGALRLYSPEPARFDEDTIRVARLVASQCAMAITNARLYSKAIEGAKMAEQMRLGGVVLSISPVIRSAATCTIFCRWAKKDWSSASPM